MNLFGQSATEKEDDSIINRLLGIIENLTCKAHPVHLVLTTIINKSKFSIMSLSLAANQAVTGLLGLVDSVTGAAVTATFTAENFSSDTPAAFTAVQDTTNPNQVDVTAVAAGSGNILVAATAAYTDSTGTAQTKPLTVSIPVTITAVVTADAVGLTVTFGAPTTQPAAVAAKA
jgi:hypothetical protein